VSLRGGSGSRVAEADPRRPALSIRVRATLAFAIAIAVLAAAGSVAAYLVVRSQLRGQAADAAGALARAAAATEDVEEAPLDRLAGAGDRIWLVGGDGRVEAATFGAPGRTLSEVRAAVARAEAQGSPAVASATARRPEGGLAVAVVRSPALEDALDELARALIVVGLVGLGIAVALGALLAARVLRPVERMREAVDRIPGDDLGRRLPPGRADELGRLAAAFNRLLARAERAAREQERFVADASHELRTPVTAIEGHARIAERSLERGDDALARESLATVRRESRRLGLTLRELLTLAESGDAGPAPSSPARLDRAAAEAVDELRPVAPSRAVELAVSPATVLGEHGRLRELAVILIDNALRYSPEDAPVSVRVDAGPRPSLSVRDRGPGMTDEDRARATDRFYRGSASRGVPGSGLGLAIARTISERHGATLRLEAASGGGTLAVVEFPAAPQPGPR
jgi:two-component system, OmpR family, sensor histidine kinase MprB